MFYVLRRVQRVLLLGPIIKMVINMLMVLTLCRHVLTIVILILRLTKGKPNTSHLRVHGNDISNVINTIKFKTNYRRRGYVHRKRSHFKRTRHINSVRHHLCSKSSLQMNGTRVLTNTRRGPATNQKRVPNFRRPNRVIRHYVQIKTTRKFLMDQRSVVVIVTIPIMPRNDTTNGLLSRVRHSIFSLQFKDHHHRYGVGTARYLTRVTAHTLNGVNANVILRPSKHALTL